MKANSKIHAVDLPRGAVDTGSLEPPTCPRLQTVVSPKQSKTHARSSSSDLEQTAADYSSMLYGIAFRKLGNHEDAEDAVQDALVSAFCHLSQFEGRSQMSTWLVRIVINAARMRLRRKPRPAPLSLEEMVDQTGDTAWRRFPHTGPSPEESYRQTELRELLKLRLKCLSPTFRDAAQLVCVDGFSGQEAAQALGITQSALKTRVSRARAQLASTFSRQELSDTSGPKRVPDQNH
jgi:RNA polymerase sigma-70 factor, ECF subfamily